MAEVIVQIVMERVGDHLSHGQVDIDPFVRSFGIRDIEAGRLLMRAFDAGLLRGRLVARAFTFRGHISGIANDVCPVWR